MRTIIHAFIALAALAIAASAQVVISEIHYHPVEEPAFNTDGTPFLELTNDFHEFVEIQNTTAAAVDLSGWKLAGGISYTFPTNTTIAAGGYQVIAKIPARIAAVYSLSTADVLGPYSGFLGNGSDTVRIRDAAGNSVDAVTYDSRFPWPASADALGAQDRFTGLTSSNYQYKGRSLQRVSVSWPSGDPANWLASPLTGPTPGTAQAVTRTVPKPVVVAQSAVQTTDGAIIVRSDNAVTVSCAFSATNSLSSVTLEYFLDNVNSTTETRSTVTMTDLGSGKYTAAIPGQVDRSVVRYRFKANRGDGLEVVSPRSDDPQIAPIGTNGVREAWWGYFVTPVRTSTNPIYDVFVSTTALSVMNSNVTQSPKRVTAATVYGLPRDVPYVATNAPQWNGAQPAVFTYNGEVWDIQIRYHGSLYHRAAANNSFKLHFPEHQPYNEQSSWFVTGHGAEFIEAQKLNRLLGLPASKMRTVDWFYNSNAMITRSEQGEYAGEMLDAWHELQQQLNPGSDKEQTGELYKDVGHRQNETEGPYADGNEAPLAANAGWTQLQRYEWTFSLQNNHWKGSKPVRDLIEGMWTARGDTVSAPNFTNTAAKLTSARTWFTNNWDIETTITSMALLEWMSIWDDAKQNHFFWRRANGKWSRLGWDYDQVMSTSTGGGGTGGGTSQTIYGGEYGAPTVFDGVNWWKDTFYKCFRTEYQKRLWELNNSFCDPTNLTALGFTKAATFASSRRTYVNTQLASLGTYYKPARPSNVYPITGGSVISTTNLVTSAYSHPQSATHSATKWEIRTASGDYEEPLLSLTSTQYLTALTVPYDQLTYGQTYFWRATHIDAKNHPSIVSAETSFTWGTTNTTAGVLVLNEILAYNRTTLQNGSAFPDYIELRNNASTNISLAGYSLSDSTLNPTKYVFPTNTTIAAGGYLLVWCDDDTTASGLHTGFGLDADGQTVLLIKNSTNIVDSVTFGIQAPDVSIGRIVNGTGGWQANTPTPLTANSAKTLGAVSSLRINEWMADPAYGDDWFELYNTSANVVALAGLYLSDTPSDPAVTALPALSFIAGNGFARLIADGKASGGSHVNFKLAKSGESIVLTAVNGATALDTITFSAQTTDISQGRLPDGATTIVSFSAQTASPGNPNWMPAAVYINEVLSHAYPPFEDAVEIHNPTTSPVDIGGWWLSDDRFQLQKYQIPSGTSVPAKGYVVLYEGNFGGGTVPFAINAWGDEVMLSAANSAGTLTGYGSLATFGPSPRNQSFGRVTATGLGPASDSADFWPQTAHTFGQDNPADEAAFRTGGGLANATPKIGPVVINEIRYHPCDITNVTASATIVVDDSFDEYVELYNLASTNVDLSGWRLRGGSEYTFATNTTFAAGGYLLLVSFDPTTNATTLAAFRASNGVPSATPIYGPYSEKLDNSTHDLELAYPAILDDTSVRYRLDEVKYRDIAPWPTSADGTGHSLQRMSLTTIGNTAANWSGAVPTPGAVNAGVLVGLAITTASPLPGGIVGTSYSATLAASGGSTPYSWTMTPSSLAGLTLSSAGVLDGTPTTAGVFTGIVQVADSAGATASNSLQVTIAASALAISTAAVLPDGTVATAYAQTLAASGGTAPYTWSLTSGSVPGGLTLNGAGVLSGTPTNAGTYSFTVTVADTGGLTTARTFSLYIPVPPLTITSSSPMVNGELGTAYSQALTAVGGVTPYSWSVASSSLPGGLTLSANGTLSGTPTTYGAFTFTAQVTDGANRIATKALSLTVWPQPLLITVSSLDDGVVGDAYTQTLTASGGIAPYTWSVANGTLPVGLSLTSAGVLSGTLSNAATSTFALKVTDSINTNASRAYTVTVSASGPLDHFAWDTVPTNAYANTPFAVSVSARDASERVVSSFNGAVSVAAASGNGSLTSPILITELTDGGEDQFELQNVTRADVDATGWFVLLGDSQTDINTMNAITYSLPGTLAAGGLLRVTESSTSTADGRLYFGGTINWSSASNAKSLGWIMLFDASYKLRDFVAIGWTNSEILSLSVDVNGNIIMPASQWSGAPLVAGTRGAGGTTLDSWQRIGTNDNNTASDWAWCHNTTGTDATSFNATNTGLTLPWAASTSIAISPTSLTLTNGACIDSLTITQAIASVYLTAEDDADHAGVSDTFDVAGLTVITTSPLPDGAVGNAYSTTLAAAGGATPYTWTMSPGSVSGLALSSAGVLSGTPTNAGVFTCVVRVTDSTSASATNSLQITIAAASLVIGTDATLPTGTVAVAYSQTLTAAGGTTPYNWSLTGGSLPGGISLSGAGVLSGTPTNSGAFSFTATVTDNTGLQATRTFALRILAAPLVISSTSPLPAGELGTAYSQPLTASGGVAPYAWNVVGGALPAGLGLSTNGVLSGVPAAYGTFVFTVQVTDSAATTASQQFSLTVVPQPLAITATSLADGVVGDTYTQTLMASGGVTPYTWSVSSGALPGGLSLDANGVLSGTLNTATTNTFTVRVADSLNTNATRAYTVRVTASGPLDHFTWGDMPTNAYAGQAFTVSLTARDASERLVTGFSGAISLSAASASTNVVLSASTLTLTNGTCTSSLTITQAFSSVRLTASDGNAHTGVSAAFDVLETDSDKDGMPDAWETAHQLSVGVNDAALDPDGDGASNLAEYNAGTDPQSKTSKFVMLAASLPSSGQVTVTWSGMAGKRYRLSWSTDLTNWTLSGTWISATTTGVQTTTLDSASATRFFVRVEVGEE